MQRYDITVLGAFGIDTNIYLQTRDIDFTVEANFNNNIDYPGQAGNYSAHSFTSLGKQIIAVAALGNDYMGDWIADELKNNNIDLIRLLDTQGTKRSVNVMYKNGNRKNFYDGKGSMDQTIDPDDKKFNRIYQSKLAHIEIVNWTRYFLNKLSQYPIIISVDLQDVISPDDQYRLDYIKAADFLFFSDTNISNLNKYTSYFLEVNPEVKMIVGRGNNGASYISAKQEIHQPSISLDLPIIDTNGAGDSLATGFLTSLLFDNYDIEQSLLRGQINARYTCGIKASINSLLTRDKMNKIFNKVKLNER